MIFLIIFFYYDIAATQLMIFLIIFFYYDIAATQLKGMDSETSSE